MTNLVIEHYADNINKTPAVVLALEEWLESYRNGYSDDVMNIFWDDSALVAYRDGDPIGVIIYRKLSWMKTIHVAIGYVRPQARRSGVYTTLWQAMVSKTQELKFLTITGTTHVNNIDMQAVMQKLNRPLFAYTYNFEVPKT